MFTEIRARKNELNQATENFLLRFKRRTLRETAEWLEMFEAFPLAAAFWGIVGWAALADSLRFPGWKYTTAMLICVMLYITLSWLRCRTWTAENLKPAHCSW